MDDEQEQLTRAAIGLLDGDDLQLHAAVVIADPAAGVVAPGRGDRLRGTGGHHVKGVRAANPVPPGRLGEPNLHPRIVLDEIESVKHIKDRCELPRTARLTNPWLHRFDTLGFGQGL